MLANRCPDLQVFQVGELVEQAPLLSLLQTRKASAEAGNVRPLTILMIPFTGFTAPKIQQFETLVGSVIDSNSVDASWKVVV